MGHTLATTIIILLYSSVCTLVTSAMWHWLRGNPTCPGISEALEWILIYSTETQAAGQRSDHWWPGKTACCSSFHAQGLTRHDFRKILAIATVTIQLRDCSSFSANRDHYRRFSYSYGGATIHRITNHQDAVLPQYLGQWILQWKFPSVTLGNVPLNN
jgi:hypothetical protein